MSFHSGFLQRSLTKDSHVNLMNMILAMILTVMYQPVKKFFDKFTDVVFTTENMMPYTFTREIR